MFNDDVKFILFDLVSRKHAKFMFRLRSFLDTRPSKSVLKKRGIFRERVFGCDLGELLHKTGDECK